MCIRRNFSFCVLSPTEVAQEFCDNTGSHPTPLHLWQQISLQLAKRSFSRVLLHSNACIRVRGMEGVLRKGYLLAGLWTIYHLQLFHAPFFSMLQLLIWMFEELAAVTACCFVHFIFFFKAYWCQKRQLERVTLYWGTGMNLPQLVKNPQMKGYKNNVVIDKKHSNNDLTI